MVTVKVESGTLSEWSKIYEVPKEKWNALVSVRRSFMATNITFDCRCLVKFVQDAEQMWESLGYESADDLIARGYELEPEEVHIAVRWLELNAPDEVIGLPEVVQRGKREKSTLFAAKQNPKPLREHGSNQHEEEDITNSENVMSSPVQQGNAVSYRIRKLRRDHPEIAARLDAGEFKSVAAAERVAEGLEAEPPRKVPTALDLLRRAWAKATPEEREVFAHGEEGDAIEKMRQ